MIDSCCPFLLEIELIIPMITPLEKRFMELISAD
jgi:hypothetical protein